MTRTSRVADPRAGSAADEGTLRALEFGAIVEQLAALTAFEPSRELALATVPGPDAVHVGLLQDQTDEADRLLADQAQACIGGARDIRAALERAGRGGRLTPAELLEVGETLDATDRFGTRLKTWRGPHLSACATISTRRRSWRPGLRRSLDEGGELLDTASPELAAIRKRLRTAQDRVRERLNAMLRSSSDRRHHRRGDRDGPRRALRHPDPRRGQGPGEGDRPRPERVGSHAVRRAADRRRAEQQLDGGDAGRSSARRSASSTC